MDFVVGGLDKKSQIMSIFLELSKAFNCVNFKLFLKKFERIGIQGLSLMWLQSYIHCRTQHVIVKERLSKPAEIGHCAPQGFVLGPV